MTVLDRFHCIYIIIYIYIYIYTSIIIIYTLPHPSAMNVYVYTPHMYMYIYIYIPGDCTTIGTLTIAKWSHISDILFGQKRRHFAKDF